jgi:hypothetical protein
MHLRLSSCRCAADDSVAGRQLPRRRRCRRQPWATAVGLVCAAPSNRVGFRWPHCRLTGSSLFVCLCVCVPAPMGAALCIHPSPQHAGVCCACTGACGHRGHGSADPR